MLITACDWLVGEGECKASDGEYEGQIEVKWGDLSYEGNDPELLYYQIERSKDYPDIFLYLANTSGTSYMDTAVIPGIRYYYRVRAFYDDSSSSDYTTTDSGFAMNAEILPIGSYAEQYYSIGTAGPAENQWKWYKIIAQEDWSYTVYTYTNGSAEDTYLYLYDEEDIVYALAENDEDPIAGTTFSRIDYTFTGSGVYYIKVSAFDTSSSFRITMWHHP